LSGALVASACATYGTAASAANLKAIDPPALQVTVEALGEELMLPGECCGFSTRSTRFRRSIRSREPTGRAGIAAACSPCGRRSRAMTLYRSAIDLSIIGTTGSGSEATW
jgi:hypothetical protein